MYLQDTESTTYFNNVSSVTLMFCSDHGLRDHQQIYFAVYQLLVMFIIPTVLMDFCYSVVIYVLWISRRTLVKMTASPRYVVATLIFESCSQWQRGWGCLVHSFIHWRGHQTSPTVVSLKGRLPVILQSTSTLSCDIIQRHSLFGHGFIKKPKSKFNRNRK